MRNYIVAIGMTMSLASCSSGSEGGGGGADVTPDPKGSSAAGETSGTTGGDTSAPFVDRKAENAFVLFQGTYESESTVATPKALHGCALEAPDLGDRVLYVERASLQDPEELDRQWVVVIDASQRPAMARIYEPEDASAWAGLCATDARVLASPIVRRENCDLVLSGPDHVTGVSIANSSAAPIGCVDDVPGAAHVATAIVLDELRLYWEDVFLDEAGNAVGRDPAEDGAQYLLLRKTPVIPPEGEP